MSEELVPVQAVEVAQAEDRRAALERLTDAAETTDSPQEARQIMIQGSAAADLLRQAQAPFDEAWMAGKASTIASRRLGQMLKSLSPAARRGPGIRGIQRSERRLLGDELGLTRAMFSHLVRLADTDQEEFERYLMRRDRIPSVNGALVHCRIRPEVRRPGGNPSTAEGRRNARVKTKTPTNPSIDGAYGAIINALGHLKAVKGGGEQRRRDSGEALQHLYAAEDLLRSHWQAGKAGK